MTRRLTSGLLAAALLLAAPTARAQDYMGMVEAYGQAIFDTLQNEILGGIIQGGESAPDPSTVWPAHITEASVGQHVFTVEELHAMRFADHARMRALLDGQTITVQGLAEHPARAKKSINLIDPGSSGYRVWAYWKRPPELPAEGALVTLRGVAELKRRSALNLLDPEILEAGAGTAPAPLLTSTGDALSFTPSPAVTAVLAEALADALAPSLSAGYGRQDLVELITGGQLQAAFRTMLKPYGFSDRDVADVMAAHMIVNWQVANGDDQDPPRRGILAVRDATRAALLESGWAQSLSDAEKQYVAERMVVTTMLVAGRYVAGKQSGNRDMVAMAMQDARDLMAAFGAFDPLAFVLTERGFEPK